MMEIKIYQINSDRDENRVKFMGLDTVTVKTSKREKARAKMIQLLEQSDQPAKEVYESLADMVIGSRTVEKVKKELQITAYRSGGCWYWKLPTKEGMRRNG